MSERERFEQWMQTQTVMPGCDLKRGDGMYAWIIVQLAWEAWQAGHEDTRKNLEHLERKVAHGCTDASCKECDQ